jgi:hypothetical protein
MMLAVTVASGSFRLLARNRALKLIAALALLTLAFVTAAGL